MIKTYIEQAIKNLESEKASELSVIENRVIQNKVVKYNMESDKKRDEEVGELTTSFNKAVQELQTKYNSDKQTIMDRYNAEKSAYKQNAILSETSSVAYEYDKHIAKLQEMIKE